MNEPELHADWFPLDDAQHEAQVRGLLALLERPAADDDAAARPVLDLGCGDGRLLVPLAQAGFDVVGVDSDDFAVALCRQRLAELDADAQLIQADFTGDAWLAAPAPAPYQAALCLGNTFLLVHEIDDAVTLLTRLRDLIAPGGAMYLDDFCAEMWREVAEGYWQEGVSEDGSMQLLWAPGENVIALRSGDAVDETADSIRPGDMLCRLWTLGDLRLLARLCGWGEPEILPAEHLLRLRRA